MVSSAIITEPPAAQQTAITVPNALEVARNAVTQLWNMLQDEDGNPLSPAANDYLLALYDHYELIAAQLQQSDAQVAALLETLNSARQQRDQAIRQMEAARKNGERATTRSILTDIRLEFEITPETAQAALDLATGIDTQLPFYVRNSMRRTIELIEEELNDQREQEALDAGLGDPDDDHEPE